MYNDDVSKEESRWNVDMQLANDGLPYHLVRLGTGVHNRTDSSALATFPLPNVPEKGNCNASGNIGKIQRSTHLNFSSRRRKPTFKS
jgi:hypothetical protein